ncbi:MAG: tetratricopeptide repeat protein [Candidatus Acidiferrales bacterium]
MSNNRSLSLLLRTFLVCGLLYCMYLVTRRAVGAWYFRKHSPQDIQTAIKWDPGNPEYYDALATLTHLYSTANPADVVRLNEKAVQLSPYNADYWADLGAAYEWAGRNNDALRAFTRARTLFPNSPQINWKAANFYVRTRRTSEALAALQKVLLEDGTKERQVFVLAVNATNDNQEILDQMLPPHAPVIIDYLNFQIETGRMEAADRTWAALLELKLPFDLARSFPYLDALVQRRDVERLTTAWAVLCSRFPQEVCARESSPNLITNGDFAFAPLNGGLDWRVIPIQGAAVSEDPSVGVTGSKSLRIDFDGKQNLEYGHVLQYVPVAPNTAYKFSGHMRAQGITTDSGPRFEVLDAYDPSKLFVSTENVTGTSDWSAHQLEFKTGADTRLLIVKIARPASHKFDDQLAGTIWIARVALVPK